MTNYTMYVKCAFCGDYAAIPGDGGEVPLEWFFVARPRKAQPSEVHEHPVMTPHGVDTVTATTHVDRWLFCSEDCLAHVAEIGTSPSPEEGAQHE